MVTLLARIFIKEDGEKTKVRQAYGMLCGIVGILLNLILFAGKFLAGTISGSIAITADAFNNLSDAGSSVVTLIGFKLAGSKPDPEHPFGHGRIEYVSGLVVAAAILLMAVELIRDSAYKIFHPQQTEFSWLIVGILVASILVKLYMAFYNHSIAVKIDSAAMKSTAMDSLSDSCATMVVLVATLVAKFTGLQIDGYCGVAVGLLILWAGIGAARETLNPLLGQPPEEEFVQKIADITMSEENILGMHDLIVHDYGPGRVMISLHAEVPAEADILHMHDMIDNVEKRLREELSCDAVIHMDPIVTNSKELTEIKNKVYDIVKEVDNTITMHDFRMVQGPTHTNLIFDVVVPFRFRLSDEAIESQIKERIEKAFGKNYNLVLCIDKAYVS